MERPAAEGEEASSKVNGHTTTTTQQETNSSQAKAELAWQEKILSLTAQQDHM